MAFASSEIPGGLRAVAEGVLDFITPAATLEHATLISAQALVHVIGTTGLERSDLEKLAACGRHSVIVRAGTMSVGVNLLTVLARQAAAVLGPEYDIEIVEMHHRNKVDAPSGTALMLGQAAAEGRGVALDDVSDRGPRRHHRCAEAVATIGFTSIRGGDMVGEHEMIFAGPTANGSSCATSRPIARSSPVGR